MNRSIYGTKRYIFASKKDNKIWFVVSLLCMVGMGAYMAVHV